MADYHTLIVVQQTIPLKDMTPLEKLILEQLFDSETVDDGLYFFSDHGTNDVLSFAPAELQAALEQSDHTPSGIYDTVKGELASADPDAEDIELDFSIDSFETIFQDIVKRSSTLSHISVAASFICSKMRPDGFGGMVTLITPAEIFSASTNEILEKWLADKFP
ncbi:MAG: hypothetical protein ACLP02_18820 [Rhodomicrobium sp.]